jgi:Raf kinase inhibitor-like YbhB/YbcL family protein
MQQPPPAAQMQVTSSAFTNNQPIPADYTCDGKNISPPLAWSGAPSGTKSFVLICDDPDAPRGVWTHWVVFNLSPETTSLPEDTANASYALGNAKQGLNDFQHPGYGGPCPPPGKPHRYFFRIYALDSTLDLNAGTTKKEVETAMASHVLASGQLIGKYQRK